MEGLVAGGHLEKVSWKELVKGSSVSIAGSDYQIDTTCKTVNKSYQSSKYACAKVSSKISASVSRPTRIDCLPEPFAANAVKGDQEYFYKNFYITKQKYTFINYLVHC